MAGELQFIPTIYRNCWRYGRTSSLPEDLANVKREFGASMENIVGFCFALCQSETIQEISFDGMGRTQTLKISSAPKRSFRKTRENFGRLSTSYLS
jgi:hypothetical protein